MSSEHLDRIETPVPVVDLDRMDANIARTARYARDHGFRLRPHVKTHKSPYVGALQLAAGAAGVTCATTREAEVMQAATDDIMLAYPTVGAGRAQRIVAVARDARVRVMIDSAAAIDELAAAAISTRAGVGVLVEVDLGMRRTGVGTPAEAVALARKVQGIAGLEYLGIGFYPGHIREPVEVQGPLLARLSARLAAMIDALQGAGLAPAVVSGGSTPTLWRSHEIDGLTEIRPGTSVYNDRTTAAIGACRLDDCALTVLATVVSTAVDGRAVIDAGTKSLGREAIRGVAGEGFGVLIDHPDVHVAAMSEEHGLIDWVGTPWRPRVGDRVRIVPNHVCIVTHLFDRVYGLRRGEIEREWAVAARGR